MMFCLTYGILPSREQFAQAWQAQEDAGELRGGLFHFGNDPRVGTDALNESELWTEIGKALREYESGDEFQGDWISFVLGCLSIEWI